MSYFEPSPLLGKRARFVHETFVSSLSLDGDVAELGVFEGHTSRNFVSYLEASNVAKTVHLFDTFAGLPPIMTAEECVIADGRELRTGNYHAPLPRAEAMMEGLRQYKLHVGLFVETLPGFNQPLCFMHVDADLYVSTVQAIELADRCLVSGGSMVFDDYDDPAFPGIRLAVERTLSADKYEVFAVPGGTQYLARKRRS